MLAIRGGELTKKKSFPKWPISGEEEKRFALEVIESGNWWRMSGDKVKRFEKEFAEFLGVKNCLAVANGTQAIELALAGLGLQKDDEVIVSAFTFISTFNAPIYANVKPIPVDVDEETFCMIPETFERAITPNTKAVIPVHMAGHMCDMKKISEIARKHGLKVIEDAAHAHGAKYQGKPVGYYSDAATFSFQNGKIMTCGEGGAVVTNNDELYERLFLLHGVGRPENDKGYHHVVLGNNSRMSEIQAALLLGQLQRVKEQNQTRIKNAKILDDLLSKINGIKPQGERCDVTVNTHYMYMFYYDKQEFHNCSREKFVEMLNAEGIPAFISYPLLDETEFFINKDFRGYIEGDYSKEQLECPNAQKIAENVVWLPHYTLLGDSEDMAEIAEAIKKIQIEI